MSLVVCKEIENLSQINNAIVTVGTFDGVHLAHREIIAQMKEMAAEIGGKTVLVTFFPHPCKVLNPERYGKGLQLLTTQEEKIELLTETGLDYMIEIPFTTSFASLPPSQFVTEFLVNKVGVKKMVVGYNHNFGSDRMGDHGMLETLGIINHFTVVKLQELIVAGEAISSTRIRRLLKEGEILLANQLLASCYQLSGTISEDTEFIPEADDKVIPAPGTYKVLLTVNRKEMETTVEIDEKIRIKQLRPEMNGEHIKMNFLENLD